MLGYKTIKKLLIYIAFTFLVFSTSTSFAAYPCESTQRINVNLYFHNIANAANGAGGYNSSDINAIMSMIATAYNPHEIYFRNTGWRNWVKPEYLDPLFKEQLLNIFTDPGNGRRSNAINVYLANIKQGNRSEDIGGKAEGIPSNALFVGGRRNVGGIWYNMVPSMVVGHEIGHTMGLVHTSHNDPVYGSEVVARSGSNRNCHLAGDRLCDTAADPASSNTCFLGCQYQGRSGNSLCPLTDPFGARYTPDPRNLLSISLPTCMTRITKGQADLMKQKTLSSVIHSTQNVPASYTPPPITGVYTKGYSGYGYPLHTVNMVNSGVTMVTLSSGISSASWSKQSSSGSATWYSANNGRNVYVTLGSGAALFLKATRNGSCGPYSQTFGFIASGSGGW